MYHALNFETLRFTKNGKQIIEAAKSRIKHLEGRGKEHEAKIAEICKRREIDPNEVINAGSDHEAVNSYSNKVMGNVDTSRNLPKTAVQAMQQDTDALRRYGAELETFRNRTKDLERVVNNVNHDKSFELTFDELHELGFN